MRISPFVTRNVIKKGTDVMEHERYNGSGENSVPGLQRYMKLHRGEKKTKVSYGGKSEDVVR